jgi:Leucine-rich repeat (LRR) protein
MRVETSINVPNVTISNKCEEFNSGFNFNYNKKIFYLPIDVAEKFPYLTVYGASDCSVKEISKLNFNGLKNLNILELSNNQIEKIDSDTFQDLVALEKLDLGE